MIIRDRIDIFIPTKFRKELLEELHSTHLRTEPMKRLACGKFWWPKINKEIEEIDRHCKPCRTEAIAKLQKPVEIHPIFLDSLAPGQVIHLDYLEYDSKKIFILRDQYLGWSKYYLATHMTSKSVIRFFQYFWLTYKNCVRRGSVFSE